MMSMVLTYHVHGKGQRYYSIHLLHLAYIRYFQQGILHTYTRILTYLH